MSQPWPVVPSPHGQVSSQTGWAARVDAQRGESGPIPEYIHPSEAARSPIVRPGSLTYEPYYGLTEKPFSLSADPRFLYKSRSHAPAFNDVRAAIRRREGLIVLTGDIGTGKTTLCRSVLAHLDRKTFSSFVPDPFMSREDLLKMLLIDFGVMSVDDLKSGRLKGASRLDLSYPLYEFLDSLVALEAFAVLIIDEAQNLSVPLLEEVRILSEIERREKLLQVVLVGQLELQSCLRLPQMRQVDQRVSTRCQLLPLGREGVTGYVTHRLNVAGGERCTNRFTATALDAVFQVSGGVPRLINLICDRALQRGYLSGTDRIEPEIIWSAVADLGLSVPPTTDTVAAVTNINAVVADDGSEQASAETTVSIDDDLKALFENSPALPRESDQAPVRTEPAAPVSDVLRGWPTESQRTRTARGRFRFARNPLQETSPRRVPTLTVLLLVAIASVTGGGLWYYYGLRQSPSGRVALPDPPASPPLPQSSNRAPRIPAYGPQGDAPQEAPAAIPARGSSPNNLDPYQIQVASFESPLRADNLVNELANLGYRARRVDLNLGERGRLQQILVGRYRTREEAQRDLARIQEMPGYADARINEPPQLRASP